MGFADELQKEISKLRALREDLMAEIGALDAELKDCTTALRVARKLGAIRSERVTSDSPTVSVDLAPSAQDVPKFKGHTSKLAHYLLEQAYPRGMTSGEIRQIAAERHETEMKQTSLTVTLGRSKAKGAVRLDGRTWYHIPVDERHTQHDNGKQDASPSEPSEASQSLEGTA